MNKISTYFLVKDILLFMLAFGVSNICSYSTFTNVNQLTYVDLGISTPKLLQKHIENQTSQVDDGTLHLFTHGESGKLLIKDNWLNQVELTNWILSNYDNQQINHINIYGCNFAKGEKGKQAVSYLERVLGVSIAASDDITGVDGDWDLEVGNSVSAIQVPSYSANLQRCSGMRYNVYAYYRTAGNNTTDAKYRLTTGSGTTDVDIDQTTRTNIYTYQTRDFVPLAKLQSFQSNGSLVVSLLEDSSSTGTWIIADALLFVDELGEEYVVDTPTSTGFLPQSHTSSYNGNNHYIAVGAAGSNVITWTLLETSTSQPDLDGDNIPDFCDVDSDNDGITDVNECDSNNVANGTFTGSLGSWTVTGNWINRGGLDAYVSTDVASSNDLSQTITVQTESAMLHYDLKGHSSNTRDAFIEVYINDTLVDRQSALDITSNAVGGNYHRQIPLNLAKGSSATILYRAIITAGAGSGDDIGVDNVFIGACDDDSDSIPNYLDTDSDGDGCNDAVEAGHIDANNDGEVDGTGVDSVGRVTGATTAYTGTAAAVRDNSINSACCDVSKSGHLDSDGDNVANYCDLDADNDGIVDMEEIDSCSMSYNFTGSSIQGSRTRTGGSDLERDFIFGDSILFNFNLGELSDIVIETTVGNYGYSVTGTVEVDGVSQSISTTTTTFQTVTHTPSTDSSFTVKLVGSPLNGIVIRDLNGKVLSKIDFEETGQNLTVPGYRSIAIATSATSVPSGTFNIVCANARDTDNDGTPDYLDTDSDGDGCNDAVEAGHIDANNDGEVDGTGTDSDGKVTGATTAYTGNDTTVTDNTINSSCRDAVKSGLLDSDGDGISNRFDLDDDNDGILDIEEASCDSANLVIRYRKGSNLIAYNPLTGVEVIEMALPSDIGINGGAYNYDKGGLIYSQTTTGELKVYDPATSTWTPFGNVARSFLSGAAAYYDGVVYFGTDANDVYAFNLSADGKTATSSTLFSNNPLGSGDGHGNWGGMAVGIGCNGNPTLFMALNGTGSGSGVDGFSTIDLTTATPTGNVGTLISTPYLSQLAYVDGKLYAGGSSISEVDVCTGATTATGFSLTQDPVDLISGEPLCYLKTDTDNDGTPDYLDIDSDGDGCNDAVEAGHIDANNDGEVDGTGVDSVGRVTGAATSYTGNDTIVTDNTINSSCIDAVKSGLLDSDGDGVSNRFDLDDDNDGILDIEEASCDSANLVIRYRKGSNLIAYNPLTGVEVIEMALPSDIGINGGAYNYDKGGLIYSQTTTGELKVYDPATSTWTPFGNVARSFLSGAAAYYDGVVYFGTDANDVYAFNLSADGKTATSSTLFSNNPLGSGDGHGNWGGMAVGIGCNGNPTLFMALNGTGSGSGVDGFSTIDLTTATPTGNVGTLISTPYLSQLAYVDGKLYAGGSSISEVDVCTGATTATGFSLTQDPVDLISGEPLCYLKTDTDNDGTPDYLDIDSDGDGCNDAVEAGHIDANNDGEVDGTGVDSVGKVTGATTAYTGNDTIVTDNTINSSCIDASKSGLLDSDGDGVSNRFDLDDDNDGILDIEEASCDSANLVIRYRKGSNLIAYNPLTGVEVIEMALPSDIGINGGAYNYDKGGLIYSQTTTGELKVYDPATSTWTPFGNVARSFLSGAAAYYDGVVYFGTDANDVYAFNLSADGKTATSSTLFSNNPLGSGDGHGNWGGMAVGIGCNGNPTLFMALNGTGSGSGVDGFSTIDLTTATPTGNVGTLISTPYLSQLAYVDGKLYAGGSSISEVDVCTGATTATGFSLTQDPVDLISGEPLCYLKTDTDNDGTPDYLDIDSDGDGCNDAVEAGHIDADNDGEVDGTGVDSVGRVTGAATSYTGNDTIVTDNTINSSCIDASKSGLLDSDGDGVSNRFDLDDDNDGILDIEEASCDSANLVIRYRKGSNLIAYNPLTGVEVIEMALPSDIGINGGAYNYDKGGLIYSQTTTGELKVYDPATSTWTPFGNVARSFLSGAAAYYDGVVYFGTDANDVYAFNLSADGKTATSSTLFSNNPLGSGDGHGNWGGMAVGIGCNGNPTLFMALNGTGSGSGVDGFSTIDLTTATPTGNVGTLISTPYLSQLAYIDGKLYAGGSSISEVDVCTGATTATGFSLTQDPVDLISGEPLCYLKTDTDNDGTPDYLDIDSDDDGCYDAVEAGHIDADNDGEVDGTGVDSVGRVTGAATSYTGNDTIVTDNTINSSCIDASKSGLLDSDGDGISNRFDLDDDNDGILDIEEASCDSANLVIRYRKGSNLIAYNPLTGVEVIEMALPSDIGINGGAYNYDKGGLIYSQTTTGELKVYDPATSTWTAFGNVARSFLSGAAAYYDGVVYFGTDANDVYAFNLSADGKTATSSTLFSNNPLGSGDGHGNWGGMAVGIGCNGNPTLFMALNGTGSGSGVDGFSTIDLTTATPTGNVGTLISTPYLSQLAYIDGKLYAGGSSISEVDVCTGATTATGFSLTQDPVDLISGEPLCYLKTDTDNDGTPDYLDIDSDGDGCNDAVEAGHIDADNDGEVDGTGVDSVGRVTGAATSYTGNDTIVTDNTINSSCIDAVKSGLLDSDGDGVSNRFDLDDDNDGILDIEEASCDSANLVIRYRKGSNLIAYNPLTGVEVIEMALPSDIGINGGAYNYDKGGLIYSQTTTGELKVYDPATSTWTPFGNVARSFLSGAAAYYDGVVYFGTDANDVYAFNLSADGKTATSSTLFSNNPLGSGDGHGNWGGMAVGIGCNGNPTLFMALNGTGSGSGVDGFSTIDLTTATPTGNVGTLISTPYLSQLAYIDGKLYAGGSSISEVDVCTGATTATGFSLTQDPVDLISGEPLCYLKTDTDNDGTPDYLDIDSDGDGCNDAVEAGHIDADNDGEVDGTGVDSVGRVTGAATSYTGNDTIVTDNTINSSCIDASKSGLLDSDGDGISNRFDLDDDNDGILDIEEASCDSANLVIRYRKGSNLIAYNPLTGVEVIEMALPSDIGINGGAYNYDKGGLIYSQTTTGELKVYDPATSTWTPFGNVARSFLSGAAAYYDGVVYFGTDANDVYAFNLSADGKTATSSTLFSNNPLGSGDGHGNWGGMAVGIGCNGNPTLFMALNGTGSGSGVDGFSTIDLTTATPTGNVGTLISTPYLSQLAYVDGKLYAGGSSISEVDVCTGATTATGFSLTQDPVDLISGEPLCYLKTDTDNDGTPDYLDIDSDGDGCNDAVEAGHIDANNDGEVDGTGVDSVGKVTGAATSYTGNDTIVTDNTINSSCIDASKSGLLDSDGDGVSNRFDLDDDNDGILDIEEASCDSANLVIRYRKGSNLIAYNPLTGVEVIEMALPSDIGINGGAYNYDKGGLIYSQTTTGELKVYDPATSTWTPFGGVSGGFLSGAAAYYDGVVYFGTDANDVYAFNLSADGKTATSSTLFSNNPLGSGDGHGNWGGMAVGIGCNGNPTLFMALNGTGSGSGVDGFSTIDLTTATPTGNVGTLISTPYLSQLAYVDGKLYAGGSSISEVDVCTGATTATGFSLTQDPVDLISGEPLCYLKTDTDNDGTPDYLDIDSDDDGCYDAVEAGHIDANNDGEVDGTGVDSVGRVTGAATSYTGNDTIVTDNTINSSCIDASKSGLLDSDGDGVSNRFDLDDDNDGILDIEEASCDSANLVIRYRKGSNLIAYNPLTGVEVIEMALPSDIGINGGAYNYDKGGLIYSQTTTGELKVYDPATSTWTAFGNVARSFLSGAAAYYDGVVYFGTDANDVYAFNLSADGKTATSSTLFSNNPLGSGDGHGNWGGMAVGIGCNGNPTLFMALNGTGSGSGVDGFSTIDLTTATPTGNVGTLISTPYLSQLAYVDGKLYAGGSSISEVDVCTGATTATGFSLTQDPVDLISGEPLCYLKTDTDNDGTPDYLDIDSDNDGCYDAVESASSPYKTADLSIDGSINITTYPVDSVGVPAGNNYGVGTSTMDTVQAAECNPCNSASSLFTDSDGDNIGDLCDLDDDNDGILDVEEIDSCSMSYNFTGSSIQGSRTRTGGSDLERDFIFGDSILFNLNLGELSDIVIETTVGNYGYATTGTVEVDGVSQNISTTTTTFQTVTHTPSTDSMFTIKLVSTPLNGIVIKDTVGNVLSKIDFEETGQNWTVPGYKSIAIATGATSVPSGTFNIVCANATDTDGDGTPDYLDTDSDDDGCPDALESEGNSYTFSDLNTNNSLSGSVDTILTSATYGVPNSQSYGIGTSQNNSIQSTACSPCNSDHPDFIDSDGDLIGDYCDLDDDNDGILDTAEGQDCSHGEILPTTFIVTSTTGVNTHTASASGTYSYAGGDGTWDLDVELTNGNGTSNVGKIKEIAESTHDGVYVLADRATGNYDLKANFSINPISGTLPFHPTLFGNAEIPATSSASPSLKSAFDSYIITWTGGGYGIVDDPLDQIDSLNNVELDNGSPYVSGEVIVQNGIINNNLLEWDIEASEATHSFHFEAHHGTALEAFRFGAIVRNDSCTDIDSDEDGTPDHLDLDSDNDGCTDAVEAGHADTNSNGRVDGTGIDSLGMVTGATSAYTGNTAAVIDSSDNKACSPSIVQPPVTVSEGSVVTFCPTITDPYTGDTLTVSTCSIPAKGTATSNDTCITYTPNPIYNGMDSVCAVVCDQTGLCDSIMVLITVTPKSDTLTKVTPEDSTIVVCPPETSNVDTIGSMAIICGPNNGTTAIDTTTGCVTYVPSPNYTGSDTICIVTCDTLGVCDTTVTIFTVSSVTDKPSIVQPTVTVPEDSTVVICPTITDPDTGDILTVSTCSTPNSGTVTSNDTCITYTPNSGFVGTDSICIVVCDQTGLCDSVKIPLIVTPITDTLTKVTPEDSTIVVCPPETSNVDTIGSMAIICGPNNGTTAIDTTTGCVTYVPSPNYTGSDTICIVTCDTIGVCDTTVTIFTVSSVTDKPSIVQPTVTVPEDSTVVICPTITDPDTGDILTVSTCTTPNSGTATSNDTCITYTPNPNYVGMDSICIVVCDQSGLCDSVLVPITVTEKSDKPSIVQPTVMVPEDSTVVICPTITDPDTGDILTVSTCSTPNSGTATSNDTCITYTPNSGFVGTDSICIVVCDQTGLCDSVKIPLIVTPITDTLTKVTPEDSTIVVCPPETSNVDTIGSMAIICGPNNGTTVIDTTTGCVTYVPSPNYTGSDTICIVTCDTIGVCDTTVTIFTVSSVTDKPSIVQPTVTVPEDSTVVICPTITDPDTGDILTVSTCTTPNSGTATSNDTCITYTPNPNYVGMDSICIVVCDQSGLCDSVLVPITVTEKSDKPSIVQPTVMVPEDSTVVICPTITDPDTGDILTVSTCSTPNSGTATSNDTCITYTPNSGFVGTDSICIVVCDQTGLCDSVKIPLIVTPITDTLTKVTPEDSTIVVCPPETSNVDTIGSMAIICGPNNGTTAIDTTTGCVTYVPSPNYTGSDTICIVTCDTLGVCDTTVTIFTVSSVTDKPSIVQPTVTVPEDSTVVICPTITDPDTGDILTVSTCTTPNSGTATSNDTCITYTPNSNYVGMDSICIVVCDQSGLCDSVLVPITVTEKTDKPSIVQPTVTVPEDSTVVICPTITDPDTGDILTVSTCTTPNSGTATSNDTCITYTPNSGFVGTDSICIVVCDQTGLCDSVKIPLIVTPITDTLTKVTPEDSMIVVCPPETSNVDTIGSMAIICGPNNGTTAIDTTTGCVTYVPSPNYTGSDTICIVTCDTLGVCDTTVTIFTVSSVTDKPSIVQPTVTVPEDSTVVICPTITDPDTGDILTVSTCTTPNSGTATSNDTCITYTPNPNYVGMDSICIVVCDQSGLCDSVLVPITVTEKTDKPSIVQPTVTVPEDSTVVICPTITDPDTGDILTVSTCSTPNSGTATSNDTCITYTPNSGFVGTDSICIVVCDQTGLCDSVKIPLIVTPITDTLTKVTPEDSTIVVCPPETSNVDTIGSMAIICGPNNGTTVIDTTTGCVTYVPSPNYTGSDTICIVTCDTIGVCDTTVTIFTVSSVTDKPSIVQPTVTVPEDSTVVICPTITDPDTGDILTVSTCTTPNSGTATSNDTCITYTPNSGFVGTDSICIVVCDQTGLCDSVKIPLIVTPITDTLTKVTPEDSTIVVCPPETSNVDTIGSMAIICGPNNGTTAIDTTTGCVTYVPSPNYTGSDTICIVTCDTIGVCDTTVTIFTVSSVTDKPSIVQPTVTVPEDSTVVICPTITDPDTGDILTVSTCTTPNSGTATSNDTCITYTPNSGFVGTDSICIVVCDQTGLCDSVKIPVIVTPITDTLTKVTPEDSTIVVCPPETSNVDTIGSMAIICGPNNGTTAIDTTTGCVTYVPSPNYTGSDTICIVTCDTLGVCDTTVTIFTVSSVTDKPSIVQPTVTVPEDSTVLICPTITDPDTGDILTVSTCSTPNSGTATSNDTCITYTPNPNYVGMDSICIVVCDQSGLCDSVLVPITVTEKTDKPSIVQPTVTVPEDSTVLICPTITDPDTGDILTVSTCTTPNSGTVTSNDTCITYTPNSGFVGTDSICIVVCDQTGLCDSVKIPLIVTPITDTLTKVTPEDSMIVVCPPETSNVDTIGSMAIICGPNNGTTTIDTTTGCVTYVPSPNYTGSDTICIVTCDTLGVCDTTVTIFTVSSVTDKPSIVQPTVTVPEDSTVLICPTITDPDTGDILTVSTCSTPNSGTATSNDTCITYTPNPNYVGMDSICIVVCDQSGLCDSVLVPITVTEKTDKPSIVQPTVTVPEDSTVVICPTITDPDTGDILTVSTCTTPNSGTVTSNDTCITYTPNSGFVGTDSICIVVCDQTGLCDSVKIPLIVTPITDTLTKVTPEDSTIVVCPPETSNVDTIGSMAIICGPNNGTTAIDTTTGCVTYVPSPNYTGSDTICIVTCDTIGVCDTTVTIFTVSSVTDKPSIVQPTVTVPEDSTVLICPTITDPDTGDILTVSTCSTPNSGTATSNDTCITYTPNPNYVGMDSICIVVCDQSGLCDSVLVPITVTEKSDKPSIVQPTVTVPEDSTVVICPTITDPDTGDILTVSTCTTPNSGTVTSNDTCITYTPNSGFVGTDSICIVVCDQTGLCDSVKIPLIVTPITDTLTKVTPEDSTIVVCPPETSNVDTIGSMAIICGPNNGTTAIDTTTGCVTYVPSPNYTGSDTICIVTCDTLGVCDTTVTIFTVSSVTDKPSIVQPTVTVPEDSTVLICPTITDPDTGDILTVSTCSTPNSGTATSNDTCITYTPNPNYVGMDSICIVVCDQSGLCDSVLVPITVTEKSDKPSIVQPTVTVPEDSTVVICPTITDPDTGDILTVSTCTTPNSGTVTSNDTCITYTPNPNYVGMDSICIVVCDQSGLCDSVLVPITVTEKSDKPSIVQPTVTVPEDSTVVICPTITDPDTGDILTVSTCTTPNSGTATSNDTCITYTPNPNYVGMDSICIVVCDQSGLCDSVLVPITVTEKSDKPSIVQPTVTVPEDSTVVICPTITDPDTGDILTVSTCSIPVNGTATSNDTCITYTPNSGFVGTDSICIVVCDQTGLCDSVKIPVIVTLVIDSCDHKVTDQNYENTTASWRAKDCDGDGVTNGKEVDPDQDGTAGGNNSNGEGPTDPSNSCDFNSSDKTLPRTSTESCSSCLTIETGVWLEGALYNDNDGSYLDSMKTDLWNLGLLPGQKNVQTLGNDTPEGQPYDDSPWAYNGTEGTPYNYTTVGNDKAGYSKNTVDWVLVSLRTANDADSTVCTRAALLMKDGSIEFEGDNCCDIDTNKSYYLVIEHRSHLIVMSPTPIAVSNNKIEFDFRTNQSYMPGFNDDGQKQLNDGRFVMYAGNGDQIANKSSVVDINSLDNSRWSQENNDSDGYYYGDHTLNGDVNAQDNTIWDDNNNVTTGVDQQ